MSTTKYLENGKDGGMLVIGNLAYSSKLFDSKILDAVEDAFERIRTMDESDVLDDEGIWGLNVEPPTQCLDQQRYEHWMKHAKDRVERLHSAARALSLLSESALEAFNLSQRKLVNVAHEYGIKTLPDELLVQIFKSLRVPEWNCFERGEVVTMSSVCRRFRRIIISTPAFWDRITDSMPPDMVDACILRSRNARLDVSDDFTEDGENESARYHEKILPHCHRWRFLNLYYADCDIETARAITKNFSGLHLPLLEKLTLFFPVASGLQDDHTMDDFHVYQTWNAPSLRDLSLNNIIPRASDHLQLKTCAIQHLDSSWSRPQDALTTLMEFLRTQPVLEEFRFDVTIFPQESTYPLSMHVHLPSLRELSLHISSRYWEQCEDDDADEMSFIVPTILGCLSTPSLHTMDVEFLLCETRASTFRLSNLFPSFNNYAMLSRLRLIIYQTQPFEHSLSPFNVIFSRMPNLKHLYLGICDTRISGTLPDEAAHVPPLRTLRMDACRNFDWIALRQVIKFLSRGRSWNEFEELRVSRCEQLSYISIIMIADLLPLSKIQLDGSRPPLPP